MVDHIAKYQSLVHQEIPITREMGWQIVRLAGGQICCRAPLANNINIHGTGFAGSIYALAMASGWTLVQSFLDSLKLTNTLVAADANIKYLHPVNSDPECTAMLAEKDSKEAILSRLVQGKNAHINIRVDVTCEQQLAAQLNIHFVVVAK